MLTAAAVLTGCSGSAETEDVPRVRGDGSSTETPEDTSDTEPAEQTLRKKNVSLRLRETLRECFGSAGCNVEYRIIPRLVGVDPDQPLADDYDITYEVLGNDDGPLRNTIFFHEDGTYDVPDVGSASTPNGSSKLRVRVLTVVSSTG